MANMTWFWRLVCEPDCSEDCQTNCPGCQAMAAEWEHEGRPSPHIGPHTKVRFTWARAGALWRCWSRSVSARMLARLSPARLLGREPRAVSQAGCGCQVPDPAVGASACCAELPRDALIQEVQRHYSARAEGVMAGDQGGCCSPGLPADISCTTMYPVEELRALPAEALIASLGCGNPLARAGLRPGEVVLDLGSGGGMDVFVAAGRVAPTGRVIGLDMSDRMLALARANAERVGADNVEFLKGEMEHVPLPDASVDVIISNCVVNLAPDKGRALREAFRVLRPGGRLEISDIVTREPVPAALKGNLTAWAACIGGALSEGEYEQLLRVAGFTDIAIERGREYTESDAEQAGLGPLMHQTGLEVMARLGFASTSVRARRPGAAGTATAPPPAKEVSRVD